MNFFGYWPSPIEMSAAERLEETERLIRASIHPVNYEMPYYDPYVD